MAMIFKPKEITKDKLDSLPILAGQMITCSDTGELYFDTSTNQRISISDFIFCETKTDLDNITTYLTDKIYLNKEDNSIWKYNGSNLVNINPKISVKKTTLGLNDLIVENNLISSFIIPFEDYTPIGNGYNLLSIYVGSGSSVTVSLKQNSKTPTPAPIVFNHASVLILLFICRNTHHIIKPTIYITQLTTNFTFSFLFTLFFSFQFSPQNVGSI